MRRLSDSDLFRIGPQGLEEISDDTLRQRLDAEELRALRQSDPGYQAARADELLQQPERV
jgi:hypothetical protein